MARKKPPIPRRDAFDIAIGGEGITPSSVGLRALAELLQATASVVEAVAKASGVEPPSVALAEVRAGSAAYKINSESEGAATVFAKVYDLAKSRGNGASPEVRHALKRFYAEASKVGPLKIRANPAVGAHPPRAILVAVPLDDEAGFEAYEDIYGRLVGLYVTRSGRVQIQVRLAEGRTEEFLCEESLLGSARELFNKPVRARVVYSHDGDSTEALTVENLDEWEGHGQDFVDAIDQFRDELVADGVEIDSSAWLREIRGNG